MLLRSDLFVAAVVTVGVALASRSDFRPANEYSPVDTSSGAVSFSAEVMPLLEKYCTECHSEENAELGLKVDTYEGLMLGSDYGVVIEAGDPDGSLFVEMIASGDMPEDGDPMPPGELEVIRTWIAEGAENN